MSDIEKHLHWLRDVSGRTNLEAAAAIEALVKERDLWKSDADRQRQLREDDRAEVERLKEVLGDGVRMAAAMNMTAGWVDSAKQILGGKS